MEKARDSKSGWNYDEFCCCCSLQEQQYFYKEATEACVGPDETKRSVSEALHLDIFLFTFLSSFLSCPHQILVIIECFCLCCIIECFCLCCICDSVGSFPYFYFRHHCDRQSSEGSIRVHFIFSQTLGFLELFEEKTHHSQTAL